MSGHDNRLGLRVVEDVFELAAIHGVERNHLTPELPCGKHRNRERRHVLHVQAQPVAGTEAAVGKNLCKSPCVGVEFTVGDGRAPIADRGTIRIGAHRLVQQMKHRGVGNRAAIAFVLRTGLQPWAFVKPTHCRPFTSL